MLRAIKENTGYNKTRRKPNLDLLGQRKPPQSNESQQRE